MRCAARRARTSRCRATCRCRRECARRCTEGSAQARALALDELEQALDVDRLREVMIEAGGARALPVLVLAPARDRDDEDTGAAIRPDAARDVEAGDLRQADVEQHD